MVATSAKIGYGATFQTDYTSSSPTVWVTLSEVINMSLPPLSRDAIDSSHECAPNEWRTFVTGLNSAGEIPVQMNFTKAQYQTLQGELATLTAKNRRVVFLDGTVMTFSAMLMALELPVEINGRLVAMAKFKISGQPGSLT